MKHLSPPLAERLLAVLALLACGAVSLSAEDVYVTSYIAGGPNTCGPSCPYGFVTTTPVPNYSIACPIIRTHCLSGSGNTAAWKVTPTLANSHGTYTISVTKCDAAECSPDIILNMTTTGGALADANGTAQTTVPTTAFQKTNSVNSWTLVGYLTNNTNQPDVTFTYASGDISRFFMDAVRFQSVGVLTNPAMPARITQILYGNPFTISGTGPVSHPFALVSSTNVAKALNLWTQEQINPAGTGSFTFSVTRDTAKTRFFRVITQ
jgi:hypothetical protein